MNFILLFAGGQNTQGSGLLAYLPFILILAIMYFLMIRPQAKRQKEKQNMLGNLKKGDRVVTIGGLHGTVSGFKGKEKNTILLKVDKNTSLTMNRSSVAGLIDRLDVTTINSIEEQA